MVKAAASRIIWRCCYLFIGLYSNFLFANNLECTQWLLRIAKKTDFYSLRLNHFEYYVAHKSGATIEGRLHQGGVLTFTIINKNKDGQRLWEELRPKEAVKQIFKHFGDKIKAVKTEWIEKIDSPDINNPLVYTTNLDEFNKNKRAGMSTEQAIQETWSARLLKELGFNFSRSLRTRPHPDHPERHFWVEALFEKATP